MARKRSYSRRSSQRAPLVGWYQSKVGKTLVVPFAGGDVQTGLTVYKSGELPAGGVGHVLPDRDMTLRRVRGVWSFRSNDGEAGDAVVGEIHMQVGGRLSQPTDWQGSDVVPIATGIVAPIGGTTASGPMGFDQLIDFRGQRKIRREEALVFWAQARVLHGSGDSDTYAISFSIHCLFSDMGR